MVVVPAVALVRVPVVAGRWQRGQGGVAEIGTSRVEDPVLKVLLLLLQLVLKDDRVVGVGHLFVLHLERMNDFFAQFLP